MSLMAKVKLKFHVIKRVKIQQFKVGKERRRKKSKDNSNSKYSHLFCAQ